MTVDEFHAIMTENVKNYEFFPNNDFLLVPSKNQKAIKFLRILKKLKIIPSGFAENALSKN